MLVHRMQFARRDATEAVELRLTGALVEAYEMRWHDQMGWVISKAPFAKARWNFDFQCVDVAQKGFGKELAEVVDDVFGSQMRAKDRERQRGLGLEGECCSVCGTDQNTFPETAVYDTAGNLCETDGKPWVAPPEPVRWQCHVCTRLVCRNCTLVRPDVKQYYYHTYCSDACRAAAPVGFADDDDSMLS